jgi:hypothetical protein
MRGLTDDEAALIAAGPDVEFPVGFRTIADTCVSLGRLTFHGNDAEGWPLYKETPAGLLALQLWKAGIK